MILLCFCIIGRPAVLFLQHLFRNGSVGSLPYRHLKCTVDGHARWFFCDRGGHPESSRQGFAQVARAEAGVREARGEMGEQSKLGGLRMKMVKSLLLGSA